MTVQGKADGNACAAGLSWLMMAGMEGDATTAPTGSAADGRLLAAYRAHVGEVFRYLSRLTAGDRARTEDLTQQVFERLAVSLARDPELPIVPGWLMTVARNVFLNDVRHDQRESARLARVGGWRDARPVDGTAGVDRRLVLRAVMNGLSDVQRAALVFRYYDDLPVAEVATLLGRSVEATESLLVRARSRVREQMEDVDNGS